MYMDLSLRMKRFVSVFLNPLNPFERFGIKEVTRLLQLSLSWYGGKHRTDEPCFFYRSLIIVNEKREVLGRGPDRVPCTSLLFRNFLTHLQIKGNIIGNRVPDVDELRLDPGKNRLLFSYYPES